MLCKTKQKHAYGFTILNNIIPIVLMVLQQKSYLVYMWRIKTVTMSSSVNYEFSATVVYLAYIHSLDRNGDFSLGKGISPAYDE